MRVGKLPDVMIEPHVRSALLEDLGRGGDRTSSILVSDDIMWGAELIARQAGVVCGLACARLAFTLTDRNIRFVPQVMDCDYVQPGTVLASVSGPARSLLTAERTALNFMSHMSGVASLTKLYVDRVADTKAYITCTRKTTPNLRWAEKYAVSCGGGRNHRMGLDDAVMIKDNHVAVVGDLAKAVYAVRAEIGHTTKVEVEVDTLEQLRVVLDLPVDIVMLDNMTVAQLEEAISLVNGRMIVEASGGITLETVAAVAQTGVDYISVGQLTHSAPAFDIGLDAAI